MKKLWVLVPALLVCNVLYAQRFNTTLGIRVERGDKIGLTAQQRILEHTSLEGIVAAAEREIESSFLIKQHFPLIGKGLNMYLGAGGHIGNLKDYGVTTGVDAIMGIEYKILILPVVISLDFKPAYHFTHENWVDFSTAFSARYVLVKYENGEKKRKKRQRQKARDQRREERGGFFDFLKKEEDVKK
jgi:hypothetical protein